MESIYSLGNERIRPLAEYSDILIKKNSSIITYILSKRWTV